MKKILFVEDDREFAFPCIEMLLEEHFDVTFCTNAVDAKRKALRDRYDYYIIDLMLPPSFQLEGLELFRYLIGKFGHINAIFMTSKDKGTTEIVAAALKLGAEDFLDKHNPLFHQRLLLALDEINNSEHEAPSNRDGSETKLSGTQFQQIQDALLDAYRTSDLRQMLRIQMEVDLDSIAGGENLTEITYNLISWANRTGQVQRLIEAAFRSNPENPELQRLVIDAQNWFTE